MSALCHCEGVQPTEAILLKIKIASSANIEPLPPRNDTMVDPFEEAVRIALEIKRRMKIEVGDYLTCSIGIAENKLLAKIGSDMKKPDGVVVIIPDVVQARGLLVALRQAEGLHYSANCTVLSKSDLYHRLELTDIPGIGRRQEKNLNAMGIRSLADLRDCPKARLTARFGIIGGHHLYNIGQLKSSWKALVHQDKEIKSIGHMYTLPKQYREPKFFLPVLYKLCEMVARRLRRKELMGNVIHAYAHDENYDGFGKSVKLKYFIRDGREIFLEAARLFDECSKNSATDQRTYQRQISGIKLIGITIAGLRPYVNQLSLFGDDERQKRLLEALDKVNAKYGDFTVFRAPILAAKDVFQDSVGFGRVKEL